MTSMTIPFLALGRTLPHVACDVRGKMVDRSAVQAVAGARAAIVIWNVDGVLVGSVLTDRT